MTQWALATVALALAAAAHAFALPGGGGLCVGAWGHLVADPYDCRRYFSCERGGASPRLHNCSCGQHFDAEREVCDWVANVNCDRRHRQGQEEFKQGSILSESGQVTYNSSNEHQDKQLHTFSDILHKIYADYISKTEEIKENSGNETKIYGIEMIKNYPSLYNIQGAQTHIGIASQRERGLENEREDNDDKKRNFRETNQQEGQGTLGNIPNIENKIKNGEIGFEGVSRSVIDIIKMVFSFVTDSITKQKRENESLKPSHGINMSAENVNILPIEADWGIYWPLAAKIKEKLDIQNFSGGNVSENANERKTEGLSGPELLEQIEGKHTSLGSINITGNTGTFENYAYTSHADRRADGVSYNESVEISFTKPNNSINGLQTMSMSVDHKNKNDSSINIEIMHESGTPLSLLDESRHLLENIRHGGSLPEVFTSEPNVFVTNRSTDMHDYGILNGTQKGKDNESMGEYLKAYMEEYLEEYLDDIEKNDTIGGFMLKY